MPGMDLGLTGKRAVVAAASGGLGFAVARALAAEGALVSISSRSEERIREAAALIADAGDQVMYRVCDVRDPAAIGAWIQETGDRLGGLDIVIPNAGGPPPGRFDDLDDTDWERAYRLTLMSAVRTVRSARPYLERGSSVLFMTSSSVKEPVDDLVLSTVFRSGVAALAKTLAREWATAGIRVNQLIPGRIATARVEMLDRAAAASDDIPYEEAQRRRAHGIPLERYGLPEEYAAAALFLVSDAASYVTGATLAVDGGMIRSVM